MYQTHYQDSYSMYQNESFFPRNVNAIFIRNNSWRSVTTIVTFTSKVGWLFSSVSFSHSSSCSGIPLGFAILDWISDFRAVNLSLSSGVYRRCGKTYTKRTRLSNHGWCLFMLFLNFMFLIQVQIYKSANLIYYC